MGWWRKLWMSKVDKLKEKGDTGGLVDLLIFPNLGGAEEIKQCRQAISALLELGKIQIEVHDQLKAMI